MTTLSHSRIALMAGTALAACTLAAPAARAQSLTSLPGVISAAHHGLQGLPTSATAPTYSGGTQANPTVNIELRDNRTIINWNGFGKYVLDFKDARATSATGRTDNIAVLNRDLSPGSTYINSLQSDPNVAVYIINPNGVLFSPTSQVNVGSLIVTSFDVADADFLDGNDTTTFVASQFASGLQIYEGAKITTTGIGGATGGSSGNVIFLAPHMRVSGDISASGDVAMLSGQIKTRTTIQSAAGSPLSFIIEGSKSAAYNSLAIDGVIEGRNITIAAGVTGFDALAVSGTLRATGASATDRGVVLTAGANAPGVSFTAKTAPEALM